MILLSNKIQIQKLYLRDQDQVILGLKVFLRDFLDFLLLFYSPIYVFLYFHYHLFHEERFHASFGERRVKDLSTDLPYQDLARSGKEEVQGCLDKWYPRALDTFGKAESKFSAIAVDYGIRRWGNEELRQMWKKDIDEKIAAFGLTRPPEDKGRTIV